MNPRTKRNLILIAVLVLLVAAVTLWAKIPRTFEQAMGNGFDRACVARVEAYVTALSGESETRQVELSTDDPAYEDLLVLLDSQEYRPAMKKVHGQQMQLDHYAYLTFIMKKEDGWSSWLMDITGSRYIQFLPGGRSHYFSPSGGLAFQQEVIDLLLAQPYTVND